MPDNSGFMLKRAPFLGSYSDVIGTKKGGLRKKANTVAAPGFLHH
jgi:hypothetical protein